MICIFAQIEFSMSILILGLLALLGYSLFAKGYFQFQPEGKRYEKISHEVQDFLKDQQPGLVNFQDDELSLLSANRLKPGKKGWFSQPTEGVLVSIYHEPFIAYKTVALQPDKHTGVIGISTSTDQFLYIIKKDHTDVFINKKPYGTINDQGKLILVNTKTIVAAYDIKNDETTLVRLNDIPEAEVSRKFVESQLPRRILDIYESDVKIDKRVLQAVVFYLIGLGLRQS